MTTDKTIKSKNQPKQTNVTWVDLSKETPVEKHFINGRWVAISGGNKESDSEIFDEYIDATDQQRNIALANVSNQTANSTTGKMGYKVLNPTKTFASQVTAENTIYEIRDVFDLNNGSVTIPANCTLKFNGGAVSNGTLTGNNTIIDGKPLFKAITFDGSYVCNHVSSKDFEYATDDDVLTAVFQFLNCIKKDVVCELEAKTYDIDYESSIDGNTLFSKWKLDNCSNITINGNGAVLNHTNPLTDIPARLSQLNSIIKLNDCSYITIREITYQNLNGYDTNYKGDCDGLCVIFFEGNNSFLDIFMTVKNARAALGNHIYAAAQTNHIGLVSDSNFNVKQYHAGYGVTFSWITNSKINVESHGQHRGVYLTGASNCDVYLEWEDQWTAPIACILGNSWTGGTDNLIWHSCRDINVVSVCTQEIQNSDDVNITKYCVGLSNEEIDRNISLTTQNINITTSSLYGIGEGFMAVLTNNPSSTDSTIKDYYKNFVFNINKQECRVLFGQNRNIADFNVYNSNITNLYASNSNMMNFTNSYIDNAIIGKGIYYLIKTDIKQLQDYNGLSSKTDTKFYFIDCFITTSSLLTIKATMVSSMLPFKAAYYWVLSTLNSGSNCDVSRVIMPNYRSGAINYGKLLIQTTNNGITTSRPNNAENRVVGIMYFDTTLGKPIWWNGTSWVDATGTAVQP